MSYLSSVFNASEQSLKTKIRTSQTESGRRAEQADSIQEWLEEIIELDAEGKPVGIKIDNLQDSSVLGQIIKQQTVNTDTKRGIPTMTNGQIIELAMSDMVRLYVANTSDSINSMGQKFIAENAIMKLSKFPMPEILSLAYRARNKDSVYIRDPMQQLEGLNITQNWKEYVILEASTKLYQRLAVELQPHNKGLSPNFGISSEARHMRY